MSTDAIEMKTTESLLGSWLKFFGSTIGSKMMMAATGLGLWVFLVAHLAGNLTAFLGPATFNSYAKALHDNQPLLWLVRLALLAGFPLHVYFAIRTSRLNAIARPVPYAAPPRTPMTLGARTMLLSGLVVLAFLLYHLAHFTWRVTGPQPEQFDPYSMLVMGFSVWWIAVLYVIAQMMLIGHLSHGLYTMFQHLGLYGKRWTPFIRRGALFIAVGLCAAFASVPLAVLVGVIK